MEQVPFDSATSTLVLVNPAANRGRAQRVGEAITNVLVTRGVAAKKVLPSTISATRELVKEAIDREVRVVAVGGDGLVHHVVQEIAETSTALGIVPAGTGNDFASALRLPTNVDEMATAATGEATAIDVLKMTDAAGSVRYATTIATAGFSAAVNVRAERLRWPRGPSKYTVATLMEATHLPRYQVEMRIDGAERSCACLLVAIANTALFGGGMRIAPDASPTSGSAEVVLIHDTSALNLLRVLPKTFSGTHVAHPAVEIIRGKEIEIQMVPVNAHGSCDLRSDGEAVGSLPQTITVVPGGLQIAGATVADVSN